MPTRGREFVPRRIYIKPGDFEKNGYTDGCRGCAWLVNRLGPGVNHNDGCRMRMEKIIGEDENDERTKKVKERLDNDLAQQVDEGDVNKKSAIDPRHDMPDEVKAEQPRVDKEQQREEPLHYNIGSPMKTDNIDEDMGRSWNSSTTAPILSVRRFQSPVRPPATKRKKNIHVEEPATKKSIVGEMTDDEDGLDVDSLQVKREDMMIVSLALLGRSTHEVYSNACFDAAVARQSAEDMMLMSADVTEIFSPERVASVCKEFGLQPRMSMDIKSGYDFDNKKDRDRCWEAIERDKPSMIIGSPPCTLFSKLQELNKFMYKDDHMWMLKFQERMEHAKRYVEFCAKVYQYQIDNNRYFLHEHPYLASSWGLSFIEKLLAREDVTRTLTHMCQFGITSNIGGKRVRAGTGPEANGVYDQQSVRRFSVGPSMPR